MSQQETELLNAFRMLNAQKQEMICSFTCQQAEKHYDQRLAERRSKLRLIVSQPASQ